VTRDPAAPTGAMVPHPPAQCGAAAGGPHHGRRRAHPHPGDDQPRQPDHRRPGAAGVHWTVYTGGLLLEVVNEGDEVLVVEGYEGEPYLRIGPDGVERNRRSPATYLNDDRIGRRVSARPTSRCPATSTPPRPRSGSASAPSPGAWHDHRVHWMSPQPPRFVEAGPSRGDDAGQPRRRHRACRGRRRRVPGLDDPVHLDGDRRRSRARWPGTTRRAPGRPAARRAAGRTRRCWGCAARPRRDRASRGAGGAGRRHA
jgi:hypothetical protein